MNKHRSQPEHHSVIFDNTRTDGSSQHTKGGSIDLLNGGVAQTIRSAKKTIEASCEVNLGARQVPTCLPHKQSMALHSITSHHVPSCQKHVLANQRAYLYAYIMYGRHISQVDMDSSGAAGHANMHRSRQYTRTVTATAVNSVERRMPLKMLRLPAH